jgi:hypothetical protein
MFVRGDGDVPIVQQSVQQCGRYVAGEYRLETLHGISHWMLEEKPDAVVDLLLDCITAHRNSAYFHFATATTPEGVHWYHRHSVYRGG